MGGKETPEKQIGSKVPDIEKKTETHLGASERRKQGKGGGRDKLRGCGTGFGYLRSTGETGMNATAPKKRGGHQGKKSETQVRKLYQRQKDLNNMKKCQLFPRGLSGKVKEGLVPKKVEKGHSKKEGKDWQKNQPYLVFESLKSILEPTYWGEG